MVDNSKRGGKRKSVIEPVEASSSPVITFNREKVLGKGNNTVYEGTFNENVCAVKRILKTDGEKRDKIALDMLREVTVWLNLCKDTQQSDIPIVRCYGFEHNEDFW